MEALDNLRTRKAAKPMKTALTDSEIEQQAKDYYANVRTNVSLSRLSEWVEVNKTNLCKSRYCFFGSYQMYVHNQTSSHTDRVSLPKPQGVLVTVVLNSGSPSTAFSENAGSNAPRIYMTVILAFVAITNIIVCISFDILEIMSWRSVYFNSDSQDQPCTSSFDYLLDEQPTATG